MWSQSLLFTSIAITVQLSLYSFSSQLGKLLKISVFSKPQFRHKWYEYYPNIGFFISFIVFVIIIDSHIIPIVSIISIIIIIAYMKDASE